MEWNQPLQQENFVQLEQDEQSLIVRENTQPTTGNLYNSHSCYTKTVNQTSLEMRVAP